MTKPVVLTKLQWNKIKEQITKNYSQSVLLIRPKMRKILGFTPREHKEWCEDSYGIGLKYQKTTIHLDFYDDPKRTMFLLKYSEFLKKPDLD